jgi:hypothetical protein
MQSLSFQFHRVQDFLPLMKRSFLSDNEGFFKSTNSDLIKSHTTAPWCSKPVTSHEMKGKVLGVQSPIDTRGWQKIVLNSRFSSKTPDLNRNSLSHTGAKCWLPTKERNMDPLSWKHEKKPTELIHTLIHSSVYTQGSAKLVVKGKIITIRGIMIQTWFRARAVGIHTGEYLWTPGPCPPNDCTFTRISSELAVFLRTIRGWKLWRTPSKGDYEYAEFSQQVNAVSKRNASILNSILLVFMFLVQVSRQHSKSWTSHLIVGKSWLIRIPLIVLLESGNGHDRGRISIIESKYKQIAIGLFIVGSHIPSISRSWMLTDSRITIRSCLIRE